MKKILLGEGAAQLKDCILVIFLLLSVTSALSQQKQGTTSGQPLKGSIRNLTSGEPLIKVNIHNSSKSTNALSGNSGEFTIPVSTGDRLIFTHVGFQPPRFVVRNLSDVKKYACCKANL